MRQGIRIDSGQAAVAGLVVLAFALRVRWLGQSFWLDESLTAEIAGSSVGNMATKLANQAEAPLYFFVAYFWGHVAGTGEAAYRLISVFAGLATVPVAYSAVRILINRRAGVASAALLATSPMLVWYSDEARAYSLWVLLCALALLFWAHARVRDVWWAFDGWAVASALAFATHYFAVAFIVPQAVWLLAYSARRPRALRAVGGLALAVAMLLPLMEYQRVHGGGGWIGLTGVGTRLENAGRAFAGVPYVQAGADDLIAPALFACATGLVLIRARGPMRSGVVALLGLTAAGLAIPLLGAAAGADYVFDRNLMFLMLPLAGIGGAAAGLPRRAGTVGAIFVAGICGLFVWHDLANPWRFTKDDWRRVAKIIGPPRNDQLVLLAPNFEFPALAHYAPGLRFAGKPRPVREIDAVFHFGGNPYPERVRLTLPRKPFRRFALIAVPPGTLVARYGAERPTLVSPRWLVAPGRTGSFVLERPAPRP